MLCSLILLLWSGTAQASIDMQVIAQLESDGNALAYNSQTQATGMYQITPICLQEYNQINNTRYTLDMMYDVRYCYEVAYWYLHKRIPQMLMYYGHKVTDKNTLTCYNAGIWYVVHDKPLPEETTNYIAMYKRITKGA